MRTFRGKKDTKTYYFGINKTNNSVHVATSMSKIGDNIGVNAKTIARHLSVIPWYECNEYIIGKCIGIQRINRGFNRIR